MGLSSFDSFLDPLTTPLRARHTSPGPAPGPDPGHASGSGPPDPGPSSAAGPGSGPTTGDGRGFAADWPATGGAASSGAADHGYGHDGGYGFGELRPAAATRAWFADPHTEDPPVGADGRLADPPPIDATDLPDGRPPRRLGGAGAFDPGRRGVKALAVVAAVVVLAASGWAWSVRPREEPVDAGDVAPVAGGPAAEAGDDPAAAAEVVVAVAGRVHRPGLVRLPAGARVADAITAAGGAQPGVDVALLNLARKVVDGELILVGVAAPPGAEGSPGGRSGAGSGGRLNLNTATLAQLDGLPGVGPVLAQRILDARERRGGFTKVGDLRQVDGIGDARYEELKDLVTV